MSIRIPRRTLLGTGLAVAAVSGCRNGSGDAESNTGTFALRNARIFDGDSDVDADTVIVEDGTITHMGTNLAVPEGIDTVDAGGHTLVPGLIDSHVHDASTMAPATVRFGNTTQLEMGNSQTSGMRRLRQVREDPSQYEQADTFFASHFVTVPGGHGTQFGSVPVIKDDTDIADFMSDQFDTEPDFIKFMIDSGNAEDPRDTLTLDQARAVVEQTHAEGYLAVAHAHTWKDYRAAVEAGADIMAHGPIGSDVDEELIAMMADNGTVIIPTLAVVSSACDDLIFDLVDNEDLVPFLDQNQKAAIEQLGNPNCGEPGIDERFRTNVLAGVEAAYAAGIPLLVGTDLGNHNLVAGLSTFHEMQLLYLAGLSPTDILVGATSATADAFGLKDRGRIGKGLKADMLLLDTDITEHVPRPEDIVRVWKNGYSVTREVD
ncbi:amidohydrolase family protein [Natronoglycomyces albus]|uniref:Amidohydrolase family protein n=1 Tax=Natronoglycomyces albus TaxID=2811108 RepID=A0A895XKU4_9ACTN|nr:amidohydrolase family protein [Natronoglycomyces albus]QSB04183.1 amidohydrolase family protein [Natronoglycomyces albus]